jgi:hypothetical protein
MKNFLFNSIFGCMVLMDKAGEGGAGGGGGGTGGAGSGGNANGGQGGNNAPDANKEMADLKAANAALLSRLEKLEKGGSAGAGGSGGEGGDLNDIVKKQKAEADKNAGDLKAVESALKFTMSADSFVKDNASLLPKDIADIFKAADKETYANSVEKASTIKAAVIQSFFSVQSNLDLLTPGLKADLEDYLKLTKNGKQEKAEAMYKSVFEPTFEMLRRVKKAEALGKGHGGGSQTEDAYKTKLMNGSKKHYLGEK